MAICLGIVNMGKKYIKSKGFTLIELMVVIVIVGILVSIALPNFVAAQDRAKIASLKINMHSLQHAAEMYAVDYSGIYCTSAANLRAEGVAKHYWKDLVNPFTNNVDFATSTVTSVSYNGDIVPADFPPGNVGYISTATSYGIYGGDKVPGKAVLFAGTSFELTNH
jgi:prepilin-type N-terminal cleavage/methylation domain-containing protein